MSGKEEGLALRESSGDIERDVEYLRAHFVFDLVYEECWGNESGKGRVVEYSQVSK